MTLDMAALTLAPCMTIWGARVLYERPGEPGFSVLGIFDRVALDLMMEDARVGSPTHRVQLGVMLSDFPPGFMPWQSDRIQVALVRWQQLDAVTPPAGAIMETYTVREVQPDGGGGATLLLSGRTEDDLA